MSSFHFEAFEIDENEHIKILNIPNFEVYLLASTALSFLIKGEEDASQVKDGEIPNFVSYTRWAVDKIGELATSKDINKTTPEMKNIALRAYDSIEYARLKLNEDPSRLKIGDFEKEFWWFYAEALTSMMDTVKILKDEHKKIKGTDDDFDHNTRIKFEHGDNSWTYNVRIKDSKGIDIKGFMNGRAIDFDTLNGDNQVSQDLTTVVFALKNIARSIAMNKGFEYLCNIASKEVAVVSKARTIAIVLGGDYKNYLLTAKHFNNSLESYMKETTLSKEKAAKHILNKQLRATDSQITQVASILMPQPSWH